ncbi:HTH-type transcriptional regulator ImmR [compost metagenome]
MSDLGSRLKKARENKRLTQQQAAEKLGVTNGAISGYERNYRDPDTDMLRKLASLYGVSIDYLTGFELRESSEEYTSSPQEEIIREEKLKLAEEILNLPEAEKKLVIDMVQALKDRRNK